MMIISIIMCHAAAALRVATQPQAMLLVVIKNTSQAIAATPHVPVLVMGDHALLALLTTDCWLLLHHVG